MRCAGTIGTVAVIALLAGCAGSSSFYNPSTGQTISAHGPTDNPDLKACRAEYQTAFARDPQIWMGEIVPACMKMRGWVQQ